MTLQKDRSVRSSTSQNTYVLYHKGCSDGICASWAAWRQFKEDAIYIPVEYGKPVPDMDLNPETQIFIVDFSYPLKTLIDLSQRCKQVQVIDHHRSAYDNFYKDLYQRSNFFNEDKLKKDPESTGCICYALGLEMPIFDLSKSGALLAWEYFHPDTDVPDIVKYVSDRDLWQFKYAATKAAMEGVYFSGAIDHYEYWDQLCDNPLAMEECIAQGNNILVYKSKTIEQSRKPGKYKIIEEDGSRICVFNCNNFIDETCEAFYLDPQLNVDYCIAYYFRDVGTVKLSLRAPVGTGIDLIPIAEYWGGGGHPTSCGAALDFTRSLEFLTWVNSGVKNTAECN